jgi:hypothetical protein
MSRISGWLHRPLTLVDSWFMWGVIGGVLMVAQLAQQGVPGVGLYGWLIPLAFGLLTTEDTWIVMLILGMLIPWLALDLLPLLSVPSHG